jgi:hypothetical protein
MHSMHLDRDKEQYTKQMQSSEHKFWQDAITQNINLGARVN